jgi:hypothetical protein
MYQTEPFCSPQGRGPLMCDIFFFMGLIMKTSFNCENVLPFVGWPQPSMSSSDCQINHFKNKVLCTTFVHSKIITDSKTVHFVPAIWWTERDVYSNTKTCKDIRRLYSTSIDLSVGVSVPAIHLCLGKCFVFTSNSTSFWSVYHNDGIIACRRLAMFVLNIVIGSHFTGTAYPLTFTPEYSMTFLTWYCDIFKRGLCFILLSVELHSSAAVTSNPKP